MQATWPPCLKGAGFFNRRRLKKIGGFFYNYRCVQRKGCRGVSVRLHEKKIVFMYPHFFDWRKETAVPAKETPFYPCVAPARRGKLRLLVFYKNKTPKSLRCRSSPQKTAFFGDPIFPPYQGDKGHHRTHCDSESTPSPLGVGNGFQFTSFARLCLRAAT